MRLIRYVDDRVRGLGFSDAVGDAGRGPLPSRMEFRMKIGDFAGIDLRGKTRNIL